MGDHTHSKGGWMLSYRYMNMHMEGMRQGTSSVSNAQLSADNYAVTPTKMIKEMHMMGLMYAPTDNLTLMLMSSYNFIEMDHTILFAPLANFNNGSSSFTTNTEGVGDTKLTALYNLVHNNNVKLHIGLGLSMPTGSISEQDKTPAAGQPLVDRQLPASMQLGTGTWDIHPSITFVHDFSYLSYGLQIRGAIRPHDNNHHYRWGDEFATDIWSAWKVADWISLNVGLGYKWQDDLKGNQSNIATTSPAGRTVTTAYAENYGFQELDVNFGLNIQVPHEAFDNHQLGIDAKLPLFRDHNGYRLENDYMITVGYKLLF
ncbi:MAG: transporter [Verrucomicrobiota bacterium]